MSNPIVSVPVANDRQAEPSMFMEFFHGTTRHFEQFAPGSAQYDGAIYFSPDPNQALSVAQDRDDGVAHVLRVHLLVHNTWDYCNPEHVHLVAQRCGAQPQELATGSYEAIEDAGVIAAIKACGFDSFHVNDAFLQDADPLGSVKNIAVFEPEKIRLLGIHEAQAFAPAARERP